MEAAFIDNRSHVLKDDLAQIVHDGDRVSVAASVFSMYAFNELRLTFSGAIQSRIWKIENCITESGAH